MQSSRLAGVVLCSLVASLTVQMHARVAPTQQELFGSAVGATLFGVAAYVITEDPYASTAAVVAGAATGGYVGHRYNPVMQLAQAPEMAESSVAADPEDQEVLYHDEHISGLVHRGVVYVKEGGDEEQESSLRDQAADLSETLKERADDLRAWSHEAVQQVQEWAEKKADQSAEWRNDVSVKCKRVKNAAQKRLHRLFVALSEMTQTQGSDTDDVDEYKK